MSVSGGPQRELEFARAYGHLRWAFLPGDARAYRLLSSAASAEQLRGMQAALSGAEGEDIETVARIVEAYPAPGAFAGDYERSFRGARVVSPFETDYTTTTPFEQANELADIAGFFRAFHLSPDSATIDRVDHLAAELEFLCLVSWMEAQARNGATAADPGVPERAVTSFLHDHAGRWAGEFARRCEAKGAPPFFAAAARLAAVVVDCDVRARGVGPRERPAPSLPVV